MQSLTRTSCYVLPLKPLCSRASLARYFAAGSAPRNSSDPQIPQDAHPNGSEESERVAPVKIKKAYSELPKTRLRPDGTPAKPLPAWDGGMKAPRSTEPAIVAFPFIHAVTQDLDTTHAGIISELERTPTATASIAEEDAPLTAPKRRRARKTAAQLDGSLKDERQGGVIPEETSLSPRTRRKVIAEDNAAPASCTGSEAALNALASVSSDNKPKRGRRRKPVDPAETATLDGEPPGGDKSKAKGRKKVVKKKLEGLSLTRQPRNQLAVEILDNLAKFPHCILLTRVGQFYESYFDQAAEIARLLNIKLTQRTWDGQRVLMCGFPLIHLDKHLKTLVQLNRRFVALCEEFPRKPSVGAAGGFDRRVVRVLTPGTLIDEPFLNQYENNYLLAIGAPEDVSTREEGLEEVARREAPDVGLAWIDVSTGEFFTKTTSFDGLRDELVRLGPREIVLDKHLEDNASHPIRRTLEEEGCFVSYVAPSTEPVVLPITTDTEASQDDIVPDTEPMLPMPTPFTTSEAVGIKVLTAFLHANLMEHMPQLSAPSREADHGRMRIDAHTLKSLEIREGMREGGAAGSLLSVIKRTVTSGGTRLLTRWLCSPSTSMKEINTRLSLVAFFHERPHFRADLCEMLTHAEDATRIVQKFLSGRGDASDLSAINGTVGVWSTIKRKIELERQMEGQERGSIDEEQWASLDALLGRMYDLQQLAERIAMSLQRTSPVQIGESADETADPEAIVNTSIGQVDSEEDPLYGDWEKWTIKPEFSEQLTSLHSTLRALFVRRNALEASLQRKYDASSLTLRSSRNYGMHIHLGRSKRDSTKIKASPLFVKIAESASTATFFNQEWSILGSQIVETTTTIMAAERDAFEALRSEVNAYSGPIRRNARILDELDVTLAFANLATEMQFVRPTITADPSYHVVNGRHPTVELGLLSSGRVFTPNTVNFTPDSRLHVITGPNMAGKSTLLRQTALIAILAQVGSFVPADRAAIGITDQLFSRVGAKDDLFRDRSTFMVEMLETAEILRRATPNSLVIMDEVGRGTTVKDGLAIAFSTVHHLYSVNRCRAMFATHFHELADLLGYSEGGRTSGYEDVGFFCTDVDETDDGHFSYSHRLRTGVNRDSHGIKVAQLAGMPPLAISMSKHVLKELRHGGHALNQDALRELGQSLGPKIA